MNKLQDLTRATLCQHVGKIMELIKDYFPKYQSKLVTHALFRSINTT